MAWTIGLQIVKLRPHESWPVSFLFVPCYSSMTFAEHLHTKKRHSSTVLTEIYRDITLWNPHDQQRPTISRCQKVSPCSWMTRLVWPRQQPKLPGHLRWGRRMLSLATPNRDLEERFLIAGSGTATHSKLTWLANDWIPFSKECSLEKQSSRTDLLKCFGGPKSEASVKTSVPCRKASEDIELAELFQ